MKLDIIRKVEALELKCAKLSLKIASRRENNFRLARMLAKNRRLMAENVALRRKLDNAQAKLNTRSLDKLGGSV